VTGQSFQVYERLNSGKRQFFTVTNDGTGLGRVFDSRYKDLCAGEVKFPLTSISSTMGSSTCSGSTG